MASFVTDEELRKFHRLDRVTFIRMVVNLGYDMLLFTKLIAFWIWLEHMGFPNVGIQLLHSEDEMVRSAVEEGINCIKYFEESQHARPDFALQLTAGILGRNFSLNFLHEHRDKALSSIARITGNLRRVFEDIILDLHHKMEREHERAMRFAACVVASGNADISALFNRRIIDEIREQVVQPLYLNSGAQSSSNVPQENRTMFVTFSRAYPVSEAELLGFLVRLYGDCVEKIQMEQVPPPQQPMFALIIFRDPSMLAVILDGRVKAKYIIDGKYIWVRKLIP